MSALSIALRCTRATLARSTVASSSRCVIASGCASSTRRQDVACSTQRQGNAVRSYASEAGSVKPTIANIAEVRKQLPGTSMIKAREALAASKNDIAAALAWLEEDMQASGAKKASKVGDRVAKEGGIGICILSDGVPAAGQEEHAPSGMQVKGVTLGARAGIVELNCETDFVGRNEIFQHLLRDIAHTVALFPTLAMDDATRSSGQALVDIPVQQLLDFPLLAQPEAADAAPVAAAKTVGGAIIDVVSRLGERIHLARASALVDGDAGAAGQQAAKSSASSFKPSPWHVASAFTHGGPAQAAAAAGTTAANKPGCFASSGRVGSLLLTRVQQSAAASDIALRDASGQGAKSITALRALTRSLARQAGGMPTRTIRLNDGEDAELALYNQPFMMLLSAAQLPEQSAVSAEDTVESALRSWGQNWVSMAGSAQAQQASQEPIEVVALRRWQLGEAIEA